jgi:hypothetical protein
MRLGKFFVLALSLDWSLSLFIGKALREPVVRFC